MRDVRAATLPGASGRPNEDAYAVLPDLVVVADGATSPAELGDGCIHGPAWYAHRLVAHIVGAHVEEPSAQPAYVLSEAITRTTAAHADTCDVNHPGTPSATVAMITVDARDRVHWLVLGDTTLVLDAGDSLHVVCDDRLSNTSKQERASVLGRGGLSADQHRHRIAALVHAQRAHKNRPGGFWVAASDPQAAHQALTGERPCAGPASLRRVALLTDGATRAVDTYQLMTWTGALDLLTVQGPMGLLDAVRSAEALDSAGVEFPRMKASDDATAAMVSWTAQ